MHIDVRIVEHVDDFRARIELEYRLNRKFFCKLAIQPFLYALTAEDELDFVLVFGECDRLYERILTLLRCIASRCENDNLVFELIRLLGRTAFDITVYAVGDDVARSLDAYAVFKLVANELCRKMYASAILVEVLPHICIGDFVGGF